MRLEMGGGGGGNTMSVVSDSGIDSSREEVPYADVCVSMCMHVCVCVYV